MGFGLLARPERFELPHESSNGADLKPILSNKDPQAALF
jgi:hypothetical protein